MLKAPYTFAQLAKKSREATAGFPSYRLALLGDCATQHLSTALKGCSIMRKLNLEVFDADYNQIFVQTLDTASEMYAFKPNAVLIHMCIEKLYGAWCETPMASRTAFADTTYLQIEGYWDNISANSTAHILQFTLAENSDMAMGSYACKTDGSFIYQLRKLNLLLMDGCVAHKNVFLIDLCSIQAKIGRDNLFDPKFYYIAKMPISLAALPLVAASVIDVVEALRGNVKKCVVLDLDNTLWGGVIGDDGISGIQIGELGLGHAFSELQQWLKELKNRGVLLAVCSKNEEKAAKEPFEKHSEMILRLEDFAIFVANWEDKASNIRMIQQTLNIGMDSMVFLDDNPFERNLVHSLIPEITVPELPEDPAEYLAYVQGLNLFETASFSSEDAGRTNQYRAESERRVMQQQYANFDDYLQSLEMVAIAAPFDTFHFPRIAQLTQRSNQFNLRTIRYTEAETEAAAQNSNLVTLYFSLRDKLADHGLISVVIMEKRADKALFVNTWLMSCRVLKRGMEEFIVNKIIATAVEQGFETVIAEYIPTSKNAMVANIYEKLGFKRMGEHVFYADVSNFICNKTFIKEEQI